MDSEEFIVLKHSPFYSESQFSDLISSHPGLSILDMNICNAFTKFDVLELLIQRVNTHNPVSVICLNECWLKTYFLLKYQKITLIFKILYFNNGTSNFNKFWNIV